MTTDVDNFLEHYGVKGMRWGQRRVHTANMKALDKAEKQKDREKQEKDVTKARAKIKSGEVKSQLKGAKSQYKADRETIGKIAARKTLNKVRDKQYDTINKANEYKNGKEAAIAVALITGGILLSSVIQAKLR